MNIALITRITLGAPLLAALVILSGCASVSANTHAYLGTPRFPPANPATVQILAAEPKQPQERLGEIILSIAGNPAREKIESKLKAAAAQLGADGVFIVSDQTQIYPVVYWDCWGPASGEDWQRHIIGVAYRNK